MLTAQNISFNELVSFKTKSISSAEVILKNKGFSYYTTLRGGTQWKTKDGNCIIGSNGKGVVMMMTYNIQLHKRIVSEMKSQQYKYFGNTKNGESFVKNKNTVFINSVENPENNKKVYAITII